MHQSTTPSLSQTIWPRWASRQFLSLSGVQTLLPVTFGYPLSSQAVVMRQLRRWKGPWRRSLTHSHNRTSMEPSRSCWNGTTRALQPEEITSKGTRVSCVNYQQKCPHKKKSGNLFNDPCIRLMFKQSVQSKENRKMKKDKKERKDRRKKKKKWVKRIRLKKLTYKILSTILISVYCDFTSSG